MRLTDLNPQFQRYEKRDCEPNVWIDGVHSANPYREYYIPVDTLAEAQGIWFDCPLCRGHSVQVGFVGAPPGTFSKNSDGQDSRWSVAGSGYHDLTLQPSIWSDKNGATATPPRCSWHGFITDGEIR